MADNNPTCEACGSDNVSLDSVTVRWHSTGPGTGYWKIESYSGELDCHDCDHSGMPGNSGPWDA